MFEYGGKSVSVMCVCVCACVPSRYGRQTRKSAAITEALGDAIGGSAPSKIARTLATLFFGSLQIKWPICEASLYGQ